MNERRERPRAVNLITWARWTWDRLQYLTTQFSLGRWEELSRAELLLVYPTILVAQVFRELVRDKGLVRASSLAFTTALSVVPVLTVATTLSSAFGVGDEAIIRVIIDLMPSVGDQIAEQLQTFSKRQSGALSGVGSVVIIVLGVALFNSIEDAFNDIWRIRRSRPIINKFLTFYALITLAPLAIAISVVESARVQFVFDDLPFIATIGYKLLPVGLAMVAFTSANKLLPYTDVKWLPALVSGVVTAIAFELAKTGFNFYVNVFVMDSYVTVYGAISLIPIFLVWVYVSWVIVLFGAELTYTIQNLRNLLLPQRLHDIEQDNERRFDPMLGLEIMAPVVSAHKRGEGPLALNRVAATASVPKAMAQEALLRLEAAGLVMSVSRVQDDSTGWIPARPLEDIPIMDVLEACRDDLTLDSQGRFMQAMLTLHREREREIFDDLSCTALVTRDDPGRARIIAQAMAYNVKNDPALANLDDHAPDTSNPLEDQLSRAGALMRGSLSNLKTRHQADDEPLGDTDDGASPIDQLSALTPEST